VQRFLAGEIARNDSLSYGQLSLGDRITFPTLSTWRQREAQTAQLVGATITSIEQRGNAADVRVALRQRASLDEIKGLVTSSAHAVFHVVHEDGGWRVALFSSTVASDYPGSAGARTAALAWIRARTSCDAKGAERLQWRPGLYGNGAELTASQLCHRTNSVRVDDARPLNDNDASSALLAAFGPDAGIWARVVPMRAPIAANLVLAPIGDAWRVVAVLSSSPTGGQG
jgi:hypothetical protein